MLWRRSARWAAGSAVHPRAAVDWLRGTYPALGSAQQVRADIRATVVGRVPAERPVPDLSRLSRRQTRARRTLIGVGLLLHRMNLLNFTIDQVYPLVALVVGLIGSKRVDGGQGPYLVEPSYFGMHFHEPYDPGSWPTVPIGSWRMWDARVSWPHLQPMPEEWRFVELDEYVESARRKGISLLLPLGLSPTWASSRPTPRGSARGRSRPS